MPFNISSASIRTHIALLIVVLLAPTLLFSGILLVNLANAERDRMERDGRDTVHALAAAVDAELIGLEFTLRAMSVAPSLKMDNLQDFHSYAVEVARWRQATFALRDLNSRQLVNSAVPWGTPLPEATSLRDADLQVAATGQPVVSSVVHGLIVRRPLFAVVAPVMRDGRVSAYLSLSVPTTLIGSILQRLASEPGQTAMVLDGKQALVARSGSGDQSVGQSMAQLGIPGEGPTPGILRNVTIDGELTTVFYRRSAVSDWILAVAVPQAALERPLQRSLLLLVGLGLGLAILSLVAAWAVSRRFTNPIRALARNAERLSHGERLEPVGPDVAELRQVADVLETSGNAIRERIRERDAALEELAKLNTTLEKQVALRTQELQAANRQLVGEMQRSEENEAKIRQLQKMEAIGQLTGGIAHDFNNMLAVILSGLHLVKRRLQRGEGKLEPLIDAAIDGGDRAVQLTGRLLAFSRRQALSPTPSDVNKLVSGMSGLLRGSLPETIEIEIVHGGGLWRINVDQNQFENVLLNLAVNARDAMPEGGKLTIETTNAFLDESYAAQQPEVTPGQYVLIAVTDNGSGMAEPVMEKAFDPFFTTKPPGQGTGLGLSQVHGFVKQSGGHVKIYSELGHGTTVKLYFPRYTGEMPAEQPAAGEVAGDGNAEVVLLVEDDAQVRAMSRAMLDELGYRVIEAESGAAALRELEAHPEIRVLLTDVVMPAMNGRQLATAALAVRPDLKVIFTTGYTRNAIIHNGVLDHGVHLLIKPFTLGGLAAKLKEVL
ncbi:MAG: integral rane sensor hybrid histidine kinase [Xanthobacteraceae bacterium]|jgi:signal transduction histidine kinase/CheY-like chemotaxis protein|nr:integral rane sensor hybrid histidine kinase [Xanthobacteraceae bacterium]